ncbi:hypothetical protein ACFROC_07005 [Nocardia tengchongensis]|uniref:hypothetical protein n=1 Tax=Nocardia tengchongensis TaxID=2055889 RepID=UPI0036777E55
MSAAGNGAMRARDNLVVNGENADKVVLRAFSAALTGGVDGVVLAPTTREIYGRHVRMFLEWLGDNSRNNEQPTHREAFADEDGRASAMTRYTAEVKIRRSKADATVRGMLRSVDLFYFWLGFEKKRLESRAAGTAAAPVTLDPRERSLVRRSAAARSERDAALAALILDIRPTTAQVAAYRCADVQLDPGWDTGVITSLGDDGRPREHPLRPETVVALRHWLERRAGLPTRHRSDALFLNLTKAGGPLTERGVNFVINQIGMQAGLTISSRTLRNSAPAESARDADAPEALGTVTTPADGQAPQDAPPAPPLRRRHWRPDRPSPEADSTVSLETPANAGQVR